MAKKKASAPKGKSVPKKLVAAKKETKKQVSNVKRNLRTLSKQITSVKKAVSKKAAKVAPKKAAKVAPKKAAKVSQRPLAARKPSYTLRDLPIKGRSFRELAMDLEKNADAFDRLKKEDEWFIATYKGHKTKIPYGNMGTLAAKINEYAQLHRHGGQRGIKGEEAIDTIRIMRFVGDPVEYKNKRNKMLAKREKFRNTTNKKVASKFGAIDPKTKKRRGPIDFVDLLMEENEKLRKAARNKAAPKKAAPKKAAKKLAAKKVAPKKAAPKKAAPKKAAKKLAAKKAAPKKAAPKKAAKKVSTKKTVKKVATKKPKRR